MNFLLEKEGKQVFNFSDLPLKGGDGEHCPIVKHILVKFQSTEPITFM